MMEWEVDMTTKLEDLMLQNKGYESKVAMLNKHMEEKSREVESSYKT